MSSAATWSVSGERGEFLPLTQEGSAAILSLDESFVGTRDYMGLAYFWSYAYRHHMREASSYRRRLVHKHFIAAGLDPAGKSDEHMAIVKRYSGVR